MAAEDDKIKYEDIIQPDGSIEKLIGQLEEFSKAYEIMVNAIRAGAGRIVTAIDRASGATKEGRKTIDDASMAANRLVAAERELKIAMSDTGKQIAWLKAQTADANKVTVEQQRYIRQAAGSYDRLKSDLKEMIQVYRSLSDAERLDDNMGKALLSTIISLKEQVKALDNETKPHIKTLSEVEKAEQRLAYLQSEEGKRLLQIKAKIAEITTGRKQQKAQTDALAAAQDKLAFAQSAENQQLKSLAAQTREANRVAALQAQLANSSAGSYNYLAAQYELNKIALNKLSMAEREAGTAGGRLQEKTAAIRSLMISMQEATGNYTLSVGHYQKAFSSLDFSVRQIIRELPAAAVSLNTFFLAISNNIPIFLDEIKKVQAQNAELRAKGEPTKSVIKQIVKSIVSWQSAVVVLLTAFSMFGEQIIDFVVKTIKGKDAVISMGKAVKNVNKELEKNASGYGKHAVELKKLAAEWKKLSNNKAKQLQWIKDNKSAFDQLDISVRNINEAENAFEKNTDAIIKALQHRAKAAAATSLAEKEYEKALTKRAEADRKQAELDKAKESGELERSTEAMRTAAAAGGAAYASPGAMAAARFAIDETPEKVYARRKAAIDAMQEEADTIEKTADVYFKLVEAEEAEARATLRAAGIDEAHKTSSSKELKDLTNTIFKNGLVIRKQYEESITKLINDEYDKRRKAARDQVREENDKLRELKRRNDEYVANTSKKYKSLTAEQKAQIAAQNKMIEDTISNNQKLLAVQLRRIVNEQKISKEQLSQYAKQTKVGSGGTKSITTATPYVDVAIDSSEQEKSLARERKLMEDSLSAEYALAIESNRKLREANDEYARDEVDIINEWNKKRVEIWAEYDAKVLNARRQNVEDQLELVKKGSEAELALIRKRNEIELQMALAENAAKPASEQVSSSTIESLYSKKGKLAEGEFAMTQFDEAQELAQELFNLQKKSSTDIEIFTLQQEKERWDKQITLAKKGSLDWSDAQIAAAEAASDGISKKLNELTGFTGFTSRVGEYGIAGGLLSYLGFDDQAIDAFSQAVDTVVSKLQEIMQAEIDLAQAAVEAAEKRTEAAQSAYDAEVEARNNGYANNVATARKELDQSKKEQRQKQALLAEAQRRQQAIDSITQASSLTTASANIWSSMSSIPIVGPALAAAAIAAMWTSFAVAKVKAKQVTKQAESDEYGEGGLEFLEGGSHASGNDIDLGVKNRRKRRMRAEGGEALAIINKRRTRQYRHVLPDIIDSLNKGVFEEKYANAFNVGDNARQSIEVKYAGADLTALEAGVDAIKKQNEEKFYAMPDGSMVIQRKNVTRIIRKA